MRFLTDDGRFGLLVAPSLGRNMFRFQMIIGGQLIGDSDPCILGSAMRQIGDLAHVTDPRFGSLPEHLAEMMPLLRCDQEIHDATTLSLAGSLDAWLINGHIYQGSVTFVAMRDRAALDSALISTISLTEYELVAGASCEYWETHTNRLRR
jgi:hypothetical protein